METRLRELILNVLQRDDIPANWEPIFDRSRELLRRAGKRFPSPEMIAMTALIAEVSCDGGTETVAPQVCADGVVLGDWVTETPGAEVTVDWYGTKDGIFIGMDEKGKLKVHMEGDVVRHLAPDRVKRKTNG